ncbi:MAG: hypothetical protein LBB58_05365 [Cellulomonadaceae bacterium]|jgi:hypothetical protein|nr:hypothetical protein [Cellulomonadaceae bacterium]
MFNLTLLLHFVGWIVLLAGFVGTFRSHHFSKALLPGALLSFLTGVALLFVPNAEGVIAQFSTQHGVKIGLTVIITALAVYALVRASKGSTRSTVSGGSAVSGNESALSIATPWVTWAIGGLTLATLAVTLIWR